MGTALYAFFLVLAHGYNFMGVEKTYIYQVKGVATRDNVSCLYKTIILP